MNLLPQKKKLRLQPWGGGSVINGAYPVFFFFSFLLKISCGGGGGDGDGGGEEEKKNAVSLFVDASGKKSWCYYPHWLGDSLSHVCGIFFLEFGMTQTPSPLFEQFPNSSIFFQKVFFKTIIRCKSDTVTMISFQINAY